MEILDVLHHAGDLLIGAAHPALGKALTAVHDAVGQFAPDARLGHAPGHAGDELPAGLGKGRGARLDLLGAAQQGGNIAVLLGHIALIGPDAVMQPGEQVHVVAQAAAQLLTGVHVGVDQARHQYFAVAVDGFIIFSRGRFAAVNGQDAVVLHDDAAPGIYACVRIHGDHVGVFQQDFHSEPPYTNN